MRFAGGSSFINPGSVGRMFDGDPRASYAVLSIKKHKVEVDFFRIDYDIEREASAQMAAGLPDVYAESTRRGISLDDTLAAQKTGKKAVVAPRGKIETVITEKTPESQIAEEKVEIVREISGSDNPMAWTQRKQVKKVNKQE
jgi:hypothetical protein